MNDTRPQPESTPTQPLATASRLVAGGLSFLLVLAIAFAAGVPASQLLATVGGPQQAAGPDRAMAPETVERRAEQTQQDRPLPLGNCGVSTDRRTADPACAVPAGLRAWRGGQPGLVLRESLLALPPPASC